MFYWDFVYVMPLSHIGVSKLRLSWQSTTVLLLEGDWDKTWVLYSSRPNPFAGSEWKCLTWLTVCIQHGLKKINFHHGV